MDNRIVLAKIQTEDALPLIEQLVFNEEVMGMNVGRVFTNEEAAQYFTYILKCGCAQELAGTYAVYLQNSGTFIGIGSLQTDGNVAEVEYMILPAYWNQGYASETVRELIGLAKRDPGIQVLRGLTDPQNLPSQRVLCKNGFTYEKTLPVEEDGSSVSVYTLSI